MNPEIFRAYDIRGIAERDLSDDETPELGRAVGSYLRRRGSRAITLGRDCRLSSERIRDGLVLGLLGTGLTVIDLGVIPTPLLYYSLFHLDLDGGIMITGSHNPPDYNGLKISAGRNTIHTEEIQEIRRILERQDFETGEGDLRHHCLLEEYREFLRRCFSPFERKLRVVVDCGNGTGSITAPDLIRDLGCEVVSLYCEMDGRFPNHHPDPTVVENLQDLIQEVRARNADLGIAFDGDADRIGVVDELGSIVWGDRLMILYSRQVLAERPGAAVIGEVKCSMTLYEEIERLGGRPIMWKAGHSLIKAKMKEENAALAGEMSGHIFFADRFLGYDDATYAALRLLEIVANSGETISGMLSDVRPTWTTPELRVDVPEAWKFAVVDRTAEFFSERHKTVTVDGVRILFEDGWGLVRASNTQPALVLRFEADTEERLELIRSYVETELSRIVESFRSKK